MPYPFPLKDFTGERFGRLVVLQLLPYKGPGKGRRWLCQCDCGNQHTVQSSVLTNGHSRSCGCLYKETRRHGNQRGTSNPTHGLTNTPEYKAWLKMKSRCLNPNNIRFHRYGGRGIAICPEWLHSPEQFISDMGDRPSPKHSLDRIDNDGPYAPWNCRWATNTEQCRNSSTTRMITHNGKTQTLVEWAEESGIKRQTIERRLRRGWSPADALTRPVKNGS